LRNKRRGTKRESISWWFCCYCHGRDISQESRTERRCFRLQRLDRSPLNFTISSWILSKNLRALPQHGRHKFPLSDVPVSGLDAVIVRVKFLRHLVHLELLENGSCARMTASTSFLHLSRSRVNYCHLQRDYWTNLYED